MNKNIVLLVCLGVALVLPNLVSAGCTDIGGFTNFSVKDGSTVTLYSGNKPYVRFDVQGSIEQKSKLQLVKSYVCDGDKVLVDGIETTIFNIDTYTGS